MVWVDRLMCPVCPSLRSVIGIRIFSLHFLILRFHHSIWTELDQEYPEVFNHCLEKTIWTDTRDSEMQRPRTQVEKVCSQQGIPHEQIAEDRLWNARPHGFAFKIPTPSKSGVICLLEFNLMSDVTSYYIVRVKNVANAQYESSRSALAKVMQHPG